MEKSASLREEGGTENVAVSEKKTLKGEPQKKKKLVYFEIDNKNNDEDSYEVPSLKIEELYCPSSKSCNVGNVSHNNDELTRGISTTRDHCSNLKSCQMPLITRDVSRMMFDEFGIDLIELQNRVLELEKQLKNDNLGLPAIFSDLKSQVENFRNKLETTERYKRLELQKEPFCQRFQYRRTSSERGRKIREKFLNICEKEVSKPTVEWLKQPSFDSSQYEDEEILLFLQHMFLELGLISKFDIRLPNLRNFLYEVYKNYNEVPFHNFRHCFCVAQMMYVMIWSVDIPKRMGDLDTLILLTSCICHDLDHPGYNNIYQINARTELALLYNDISPLENHHCSVAFRILENPDCNIFASMDKETFKEVREGIIRCILATDMARHNEILTQFKDVIADFDFSNKGHKNLLSMILIKVADISNEARPMNVAEPWLDRLLTEFFKQSDAEKQEGLPVTPFMDRDKITKPSSQCSFIGFVLLPLFEALGDLLPELHDIIIVPARYALEHYRRLNEAAKDERIRRKSVVDATNPENNEESENSGMVKSGSAHSVRSRRSFCNSYTQIRQRSKSSEEFEVDATPPLSPGAFSEHMEDLENVDEQDEIDEEVDEEPVTEVEVSEKTLKFKISTEGSSTNFSGRKSCGGSRKGSRERNQYLENDSEWSKMVRDEDGRLLKRSITSDTMSSSKGSSDSDKFYGDKTSQKGSGESEKEEDLRKSLRQKEQKIKTNCCGKNKYEYRRKSLAVVERPRLCDHSKRRSSVTNAHEDSRKKEICTIYSPPPTAVVKTSEKDSIEKEKKAILDQAMLEKLNRAKTDNRYSRDFETSCWGLQNLKKDTTVFNQNPVILNSILKNSLQASIASKSEDNLVITTSKKINTNALSNNLNISKTEESIEKQLTCGGDKKRKLGSNGHLFFLSRLKHLKDRITFGRDAESDGEVNISQGVVSANLGEKTGKPACENVNYSKECEDDTDKIRTPLKAKKPHRTSGKMRKGWKALIGKSDGNSSSSLDVPSSPGSPSPVHSESRRKSSAEELKTKLKLSESLSGEKRKTTWMASPKKTSFLGKITRSEEDATYGKHNIFNSLTSSFRKRSGSNKKDEDNGASSSSNTREGSKPN